MSEKVLGSFSNSGRYYAIINADGKLRIWDIVSCLLKQEYTPDVHLTSPFTAMRWISSVKKVSTRKKRKSHTISETVEDNEFLAIGDRTGQIFLYSISTCRIFNVLKNGHNDRINDVAWSREMSSELFSCSDDQYVIQWNLEDGTVRRKWKCGRASSLAISTDGSVLVTAKKEISCWDIAVDGKETIYKKFVGHPTDVEHLMIVNISGEHCVLSAAVGNRLIKAWSINKASDLKEAVASFSIDDSLIYLSARNSSLGSLNILATTRTGALHAFECSINGKKHDKPIKPLLNIQIAAETKDKKSVVQPIPIIGAEFCDEDIMNIVYGADVFLTFERLALDTSETAENTKFLIRQDPAKKLAANKEQIHSKILPTSTSKNAHYMHSDMVNGFLPISKKAQKRKNNETQVDVPLELRLENLAMNMPASFSTPKADSLVHLLLQGLRSKDSKILHDVFVNKEENVIKTTVNRLPIEAVLPLSTELVNLLQGRRNEMDSAVLWLRHVIVSHAAYLSSNANASAIFAPIFPIVESRLLLTGPLGRLAGRLSIVLEQMKLRTEKQIPDVCLQPRLIYQDEDTEEESSSEPENNMSSNEELDDHWEEMSEIDDVDMDEIET